MQQQSHQSQDLLPDSESAYGSFTSTNGVGGSSDNISTTLDNIALALGATPKISELSSELEAIGKIIQTSRREKKM